MVGTEGIRRTCMGMVISLGASSAPRLVEVRGDDGTWCKSVRFKVR